MARSQWFYAQSGQEHGPVSSAELKQLADAGRIHRSDFVWKEGMAEWAAASSVKGLFAAHPQQPAQSMIVPAAMSAAQPMHGQHVHVHHEQHVHRGESVSPAAAGLLNWLWPGAGYFVVGQWVKAIICCCITIGMIALVVITCGFGVLLSLPYMIFTTIDAVMVAQRINRGHQVTQATFF